MLDSVIRRLARLRGETHTAVAVNVGRPGAHTSVVSVSGQTRTEGDEVSEERNELSEEELARQKGEPLPERTQMSLMNPTPGMPLPVGNVPLGEMYPSPGPGPVED
jgi:hypothetical protein